MIFGLVNGSLQDMGVWICSHDFDRLLRHVLSFKISLNLGYTCKEGTKREEGLGERWRP